MNKIPLLEKFAAQSLVYVDTGLDDGKELVFSKEKFAELIVRECGDIAYKAYWDNPETVRGIHIKEKIKQHFGVEE